MSITDGGNCPFCLGIGVGFMRQDKRGRPYFTCVGCGTRAFIHTEIALRTFNWILSSGVNYAKGLGMVEKPSATVEGGVK